MILFKFDGIPPAAGTQAAVAVVKVHVNTTAISNNDDIMIESAVILILL